MDDKANENFGEMVQTQNTAKEIAEVRKRIQEKAADIRQMKAKLFGDYYEMEGAYLDVNQMGNSKSMEEVIEARSIFVGNVDYECTAEEVQQHFQECGDVNRVTILSDEFGQPKGFGYVEFADEQAVEKALQLNDSELHGRKLKVMRKRRNLPGMKQHPPRRYNPYAYGYSPKFPKPQ